MFQAYASFEDKEGDGRRKKFSFRGEVVAEGGVGGGEGEGGRRRTGRRRKRNSTQQ